MNEQRLIEIYDSIRESGFSAHTLELIDNFVNDILYGRENIHRFDLQEHAGLCTGGAPLIGAYAVCCYARASFEPGRFSLKCQEAKPANWEIDAKQEDRLHLEDMHPANVFIDPQSGKPICIDCIVKFIKKES